MKKIIFRSLGILLLLIILIVVLYINYIAHGVTGYAAKQVASGVFVSGRTPESIEKEDINFFPVKYARNKVDYEKKEVTSSLLLLWKSKAVYNENLGCTVINDFPADEVRALEYPPITFPVIDQDTIPWPEGNLLADSIPSGIDMKQINDLLDRVFADTGIFRGTFAVTIVYKDQLVAERYRSDFKPSTRMLSWSVAKSFTNAMVGSMVLNNRINIFEPMQLKEWENDSRKAITLNNLLHMNSGLEYNEGYSKIKLTDVTTMLTKTGDMGSFSADKKAIAPPDSVWNYSSGTSCLIQDYLRSVISNDEEYLAYPYESLFSRTGMMNTIFEPDASGTFVGSSYVYSTARDYARFGLLYLHNGYWLGDQILPDRWVEYTNMPARGSDGEYGAHFWLNVSGKFPGVPDDLFYADGHDGQFIFIIPSKNLVVTRNGFSPGAMFDEKLFLKKICEAIK